MQLMYVEIPSPVGNLFAVLRDEVLCALSFDDHWAGSRARLEARFGDVSLVRSSRAQTIADRLEAYFGGRLDALDGILSDPGGTPFQRRVWSALREIPVGRTIAYGELARQIGHPTASRAVGMTNGRNPVAIVIPCHRVIGSQGDLTGYAGGLERKRWLLEHEGARAASLPALAPPDPRTTRRVASA
jgi:methylated-DNA-[protein]-cysteine S-methyltransferase